MNIGKISLGGGQNRYAGNSAQLESDISRLVLLVAMLLAAIIGGIYTHRANQPAAMVEGAVEKTLSKPFRVSMEGTVEMNGVVLEEYRSRQRYTPREGLVTGEDLAGDEPLYDAAAVLDLIRQSDTIIEHAHEDMYQRATRHYTGTLRTGGGDYDAMIFHCWIDMWWRVVVRVEIGGVERGAGVDEDGEPVSRELYLNYHYFDQGE